MKKLLFILVIVLIALISGVLLVRNIIARDLIEKGVKDLIGVKLTIGYIDIGLVETKLDVERMKVYNPAGYTEKFIAEVPQIYVDYALMDIIKGFVHLPEVRIKIKQVNAEKDKNGVFNIDHIQPKKEAAPKEKKKEKKEAKGKGEFLVNKLVLEIGTLRYIDNSKTPPVKEEFKFNYSNTFTNISDANVIIESIVSAVIKELVSRGIKVVLKGFFKDKDFMDALIKGDVKGMEKSGKGVLKDLGKELEKEILSEKKL